MSKVAGLVSAAQHGPDNTLSKVQDRANAGQMTQQCGPDDTSARSNGRCSSSSSLHCPECTAVVTHSRAFKSSVLTLSKPSRSFVLQACKACCAGLTVVSSQWLGPAARTQIELQQHGSNPKTNLPSVIVYLCNHQSVRSCLPRRTLNRPYRLTHVAFPVYSCCLTIYRTNATTQES
jgi:hypothetical protein